jgi:hypothetical protein
MDPILNAATPVNWSTTGMEFTGEVHVDLFTNISFEYQFQYANKKRTEHEV